MKKILLVSAAAVLAVAGCRKTSEAERFGYKGADLSDRDKLYFTTAPGVTNWVPARVLSVMEDYDFSPDELALVGAAGVVTPGDALEALPEGYAKKYDEPWFTGWERPAESLGFSGVAGVITHFDEDKSVWLTGETYFSSYWETEAEALKAQEELRRKIGADFHAKRFYDFDKAWIAEYVRLRVMCLVGLKADGRWSCMLDIQDKVRPGCGQWEPVPDQQERLAQYRYGKAVKAWKAEMAKCLAANHALVEKQRLDRRLADLGEGFQLTQTDDGRTACWKGETIAFEPATAEAAAGEIDRLWNEKLAFAQSAFGGSFTGEVVRTETPDGFSIRGAEWSTDLYTVRLDMAFPPFAEPPAEAAAETNDVPARVPAQYRILGFEALQPGIALPERPVLAK